MAYFPWITAAIMVVAGIALYRILQPQPSPEYVTIERLISDDSLVGKKVVVSGYLEFKTRSVNAFPDYGGLGYPSAIISLQTCYYELYENPNHKSDMITLESSEEIRSWDLVSITGKWDGQILRASKAKAL